MFSKRTFCALIPLEVSHQKSENTHLIRLLHLINGQKISQWHNSLTSQQTPRAKHTPYENDRQIYKMTLQEKLSCREAIELLAWPSQSQRIHRKAKHLKMVNNAYKMRKLFAAGIFPLCIQQYMNDINSKEEQMNGAFTKC